MLFRGKPLRAPLLLLVLTAGLPTVALLAAKADKEELRAMKREGLADDSAVKPRKRDDGTDARPAKSNPADAQARTLDRLREKLVVTDDTEWALIAERINRIEDVRRTLWTGGANARGALPGGEKGKRTIGAASSAYPERDALRSAVSDNLPDAEIKSRLARAHDIHLQNEARLASAHADLRAILSLRQEAVAVMAGLLPP